MNLLEAKELLEENGYEVIIQNELNFNLMVQINLCLMN